MGGGVLVAMDAEDAAFLVELVVEGMGGGHSAPSLDPRMPSMARRISSRTLEL